MLIVYIYIYIYKLWAHTYIYEYAYAHSFIYIYMYTPSCACVDTTVWMIRMDSNELHWGNSWKELLMNALCCFEQTKEQLFKNTSQNCTNTATYLPSQVRRSWYFEHNWRSKDELRFYYGLLHMNTPILTDKQRRIYINSVWTLVAIKRTCQ